MTGEERAAASMIKAAYTCRPKGACNADFGFSCAARVSRRTLGAEQRDTQALRYHLTELQFLAEVT